jgi:predicted amidohydrolase
MATIPAAVIQMDTRSDPDVNRHKAVTMIERAAGRGARLVVLPETFVYMHDLDRMRQNAEPLPGPTSETLRAAARRCGVYLVGGSYLVKTPDRDAVFNTCLFIGPNGDMLAMYRKIHLFEIEAPGEVVFDEAQAIAHGREVVSAETPFGIVGFTICYDLRFPELYRMLADRGARILTVPAAFAMKTGKDHWEPLLRARAIENQAFVLAAAQTGTKPNGYVSYGRSMIVDPWGTVIAQAQDTEAMVIAELDMAYLEKVRRVLPALKNRRLGRETPGEQAVV